MIGDALRRVFGGGTALVVVPTAIIFCVWCRSGNFKRVPERNAATVRKPEVQTLSSQGVVALQIQNARPLSQQSDLERKVKEIIVQQIAVEGSQVTPNANFSCNLGANDLDMYEIKLDHELSFNLKIPDEDAKKFVTVKDVTMYIVKRVHSVKTT